MKNIYLFVLLCCNTTVILLGQSISKTESYTSTETGVYREEKSSNCPIPGLSYYSQNSSPNRAGFKTDGFLQTCLTSTIYALRAKFTHPKFLNSAITNIVIKFDVQAASGTATPYPILTIKVPNSACANSGNTQTLFDCLSCASVCNLISNNVSTTTSWQTKAITINNTTSPNLGIFTSNSNDIIVGFSCDSKVVEIKNVTCDITYNCTPAVTPSGLTATGTSPSTIQLNWATVPEAISYELYTCTGSTPFYIANATSYNVTGLQPNTSYSYRIKAKNDCGASNYSTCVSTTTTVPTLPATPAKPSATATSSSQILLSGYSTANATNYTIVDCNSGASYTTSSTSYTVSGLQASSTYSYKVMASNSAGSSPYSVCSNPVGTPASLPPAVPSNIKATGTSASTIALQWTPPSGVTGYQLYACDGTYIGSISSSTTVYTVSGLSLSTTYSFKLKAVYAGGIVSDFSSCAIARTLNYNPTCSNYSLSNDRFAIYSSPDLPNINGVPTLCIGPSPWWIAPNQVGCSSGNRLLPLSSDHKIWITVWQCNYDLTRKAGPLTFLQGEVTINRGSGSAVDYFDLKNNLPPGSENFFYPDGVYDVWFWLKNADGSISDAGNRYIHVSTDNGDITNQSAYGVNLRAYDITITNSTISNYFISQFTATPFVDILAQNTITVLPGSVLLPGTQYRVSSSLLNCDNLQNGARTDNTNTVDLGIPKSSEDQNSTLAKNTAIIVFPNPTTGLVTIQYATDVRYISVHNVMGQLIKEVSTNNAKDLQLDLSQVHAGIYIIKADGIVVQKIIKH